jgi:hypothetical protein
MRIYVCEEQSVTGRELKKLVKKYTRGLREKRNNVNGNGG